MIWLSFFLFYLLKPLYGDFEIANSIMQPVQIDICKFTRKLIWFAVVKVACIGVWWIAIRNVP